MAHSPSFNSRPSARYAGERRWLVVIAALGFFAYYIASGNYAFLQAQPSASTQGAVAQTSSLRSARAVQPQTTSPAVEASVPSGEPALSAETSSATVAVETEPRQTAPVAEVAPPVAVQETSAATVTTTQAAIVAPVVAPASPAIATTANVVERWRAVGIIIETQGQEWDDQSLANVDAALAALPASVRSQLGNPALGQLHILVNSQGRALSGKQPYGGAANYFSTGDGVNELVMYPRQRVSTILHELGHAYNLRRVPAGNYAKVLIDPEMESFLAATGWQVLATREQIARSVDHMKLSYQYNGTFRWQELSKFDPLEDFGNSFAMYFYDPSGLKAQSPERYEWMAANLAR